MSKFLAAGDRRRRHGIIMTEMARARERRRQTSFPKIGALQAGRVLR